MPNRPVPEKAPGTVAIPRASSGNWEHYDLRRDRRPDGPYTSRCCRARPCYSIHLPSVAEHPLGKRLVVMRGAVSGGASGIDLNVNEFWPVSSRLPQEPSLTSGSFHEPSSREGGFSFGQYNRMIRTKGPAGAGSQFPSLALPGESC